MLLNSVSSRLRSHIKRARGDTQTAKFKQVRQFTEKERRLYRAFLNLKTQCANKNFNLTNECCVSV